MTQAPSFGQSYNPSCGRASVTGGGAREFAYSQFFAGRVRRRVQAQLLAADSVEQNRLENSDYLNIFQFISTFFTFTRCPF